MRRLDMSSIGFAALGRTLIKNNRAQRPESKRSISLASKKQRYVDPKKANPELLKQIKNNIINQQKRRKQKIGIITSIIFLMLLYSMYYIITNY